MSRTIRLSHEEIEIIKRALLYVYERKAEILAQNGKTLGKDVCDEIWEWEQANKYLLTQEVFDGSRDV